MSKIDSIDFENEIEIYKLEKNLFDIKKFECSSPDYENYIKDDAYTDQENSIAQTSSGGDWTGILVSHANFEKRFVNSDDISTVTELTGNDL